MVRLCLAALAVGLAALPAAGQKDPPLWKPVADTPYLQEFGQKIETEVPVTSLAVYGGGVYAIVDGDVLRLAGAGLSPVSSAPAKASKLWGLGDALWAATDKAVFRFAGGAWEKAFDEPMVDLCLHAGAVHGATRDDIFRFDDGTFVNIKPAEGFRSNDTTVTMADGSQVLSNPVRIGPITGIDSYSETLYIMQPTRFGLLNGQQFVEEPIDWGMLPAPELRDMLSHGSRLVLATPKGVGELRGMAMTTLDGDDRLPYEDTTCFAAGFDGDLWIGTTTGAIRQTGGEFHYFGANNWLPAENVHAIAVDGYTVYIATDGGVGIVRYEPYTLAKKEAYYSQMMDAYGFKRMGFAHLIHWSDEHNEYIREISDNDGGHTAHYLAAMSYKYAVTGDEAARAEAVEAFKAMVWLEAITPSHGFFARAIFSKQGDKGQLASQGSGGLPAKWYETEDGLWVWKGDTSSDEVNAHMFAVSIFHDLAAKGEEKARAAEHVERIAQHIIDEGWVLRDMDGQPTRWGRWEPEYLLTPYGQESQGLNGMEAQAYMWTAYGLTGDDDFLEALDQLKRWGYHTFTVRTKLTFPPSSVVPWDDELAFRCFYPMIKYTDDPEMRSIYLRGLERSWEVMRMQKLPYFNFVYGALTGNDCEVEPAVANLREFPTDPRSWNWRNSHRADLDVEPGYVPYAKGTRAISPRETQVMWGARSAIVYDGGQNGRRMYPPIGWIEDYWMGRYYGFIEAPATTDPALLTPGPLPAGVEGAKPYDGPPRPEGLFPTE